MKKSQQKITVYLYLAIAATFTILNSAEAQILNPVKWSYAAKNGTGGVATIYLRATIDDGWHIYSVNQKPGGPQKTVFSFSKSPDYSPIGKPVEPKPLSKFEDAFGSHRRRRSPDRLSKLGQTPDAEKMLAASLRSPPA